MSNIVGEKIGLSGRLVGIGKIRKDGSKEFHWLKKPISNMMLSKGVDRLFKYNWGNNYFYDNAYSVGLWGGFWGSARKNFMINDTNPYNGNNWNYNQEVAGAVSFCSYGTDGSANDYLNTTDLGARVTRYDNLYRTTTNRENLYPFSGTRQTSPGVLDARISHLAPAASSDVAVRELGYWGASYTYNVSTLSNWGLTSRIVLPSPYYLNVGERLLTTYEIRVTLDTDTSYGQFQSMTDTGSNVLEYKCRRNLVEVVGNFGGGANCHAFDFPYIDEQGGGNIWPSGTAASSSYPTGVKAGTTAQPWRWGGSTPNYSGSNKYACANNVAYTTDTTHEIPDWGTAESGLTIVQDSRRVQTSVRPYVEGSHEIIYDLILPQFWPNLSLDTDYADIAYLNVGGLAIKFGKMVDGVFTPQVCRKLATKQWKLSFKTSIKTPDDV